MLRFIFTKIRNKYRLYIALIVGVISMIAVCSVIMLLRRGSIDRLIQSEFTDYYDTKEIFPMALHREGKVDKSEMDGNAYDIAKADIQSFENFLN